MTEPHTTSINPNITVDDIIVDAPTGDTISSDLESLRDEMQRDMFPPARIAIPSHPGWELKIRTDLGVKEVQTFGKQAGADQIKAALLIISHATIGILKDGSLIQSNGDTLTFGSAAFQEFVGVPRTNALTAAKKFIGRDGEIDAMAAAVVQASGFGRQVQVSDDEPDPTLQSARNGLSGD